MKANHFVPRRSFIKTFTFANAYSSLFGKAWTDVWAAELRPLAATAVGTLQINLQDFPALLSESGSVRIGINPLRGNPPSGPTPNGQFYPVVINRGPNDTFYALNSKCTHQGCAVDPMDSSTNQITCPCHGSVYSIDGKRLSGPAPTALTKYPVQFDGSNALEIQIPNLGYSVIGSNVQSTGSGQSRYRLDFAVLRNVDYEIRFREALATDSAAISFSTTLNGTADQTVFTAPSNGNVSLFVDRTGKSGFYVVAVRAVEIQQPLSESKGIKLNTPNPNLIEIICE